MHMSLAKVDHGGITKTLLSLHGLTYQYKQVDLTHNFILMSRADLRKLCLHQRNMFALST